MINKVIYSPRTYPQQRLVWMKLWAALYAMIWITLIEFLLVMIHRGSNVLSSLHILLGFVIMGLAFYNFSEVRKTRVPGRVKRIAQVSFNLSVVLLILGFLLIPSIGKDWLIPLVDISVYGLILFFHTIIAFAIITQAAAVAIAYDMWEDKEFIQETEPGDVPPMPMPAR